MNKILDYAPVHNTIYAVAAQLVLGVLTGSWWWAAVPGVVWFLSQAYVEIEGRWEDLIQKAKEESIPWWGSMEVWTLDTVLGVLAPTVVTFVIASIMGVLW